MFGKAYLKAAAVGVVVSGLRTNLFSCKRNFFDKSEYLQIIQIGSGSEEVESNKCKCKVLLRTGHEGPEEEQLYSSTLPSTSALDGGVVNATPQSLYPRERPGTHCIGG